MRATAALLFLLMHVAAGAQANEALRWPERPLRWVVAYPAGGGSDYLARQLAPALGTALGQPVVIENRPGAAGIVGTAHAAASAPDGYTMVTGDNGAMVFHAAMHATLPYAPNDLVPVGFMARFPLILAASPALAKQYPDARALFAALAGPGTPLPYASPGVGSPHHLAMELLLERLAGRALHVPYRGTALAVQDVIGGQVPLVVVDTAAGLPQIRAGRLVPLAVMSAARIAALPAVPTVAEASRSPLLAGFEVTAWQALFLPRGTPAAIADRLSGELAKVLNEPAARARLTDFGLEVLPGDAKALAAFLDKERAAWHALIRARGLKAEP